MKNLIIVVIVLQVVIIGIVCYCCSKNSGSNFSEAQINEWRKKAARVDGIDALAKMADSRMVEDYKNAFPDSVKGLDFDAILKKSRGIREDYAIKYAKNFRTETGGLRSAIDSFDGFYSFYIGPQNLAQFIRHFDPAGSDQLDGLRVYVAKYSATPHTGETDIPAGRQNGYTLLFVGTKDEKDKLPSNANDITYILNYGKPCRPTCDATLELLGAKADHP